MKLCFKNQFIHIQAGEIYEKIKITYFFSTCEIFFFLGVSEEQLCFVLFLLLSASLIVLPIASTSYLILHIKF